MRLSIPFINFCSGSASIGIEGEIEEETETSDKGVEEKAIQKTEIQNIEDHQESSMVSTPLQLSRFGMPTFCFFC
jgi:hypothetical protein